MISVPSVINCKKSHSSSFSSRLRTTVGLPALVAAATLLYFWDLENNGWGNPYYAAAAQAGAASSRSLMFGSLDLADALSVDKPPLHTAILAISVRIFGLQSSSVLVPSALSGIGCLYFTYALVRNGTDIREAFLTGSLQLLTPVALLMFRFNNPDTTMLLFWLLSGWLALRAVRAPTYRIHVLIGLTIGLGILTKQFQALIIVPALFAALTSKRNFLRRLHWQRLAALALTAVATVTVWLIAVEQTASTDRPWIGGSTTNNAAELTFGYNGMGRLTGLTTLGAINPRGYDGVVGVDAGVLRLFSPNFAGELSWFLLPAILGAGLTLQRLLTGGIAPTRAPLAKLMLVWFATSFAIVSFMTGNVHPYYTLMLVPPMCYLGSVAILHLAAGVKDAPGRRLAALALLSAAFLDWVFLTRYQDLGAVPSGILIVSATAATALLIGWPRHIRGARTVTAALAAVVLCFPPALFNYFTITTPQQGSFPQAGPVPTVDTWHRRNAEQLRLNQRETYALSRGEPVVPAVADLIRAMPTSVKWSAMTVGGENAALYQLQTGRAVVAIGGFSGSDIFPAGAALQQKIENGEAGLYIHQPGILKWGPASDSTANLIHWITDHCGSIPVEHLRIYDLRRCQ